MIPGEELIEIYTLKDNAYTFCKTYTKNDTLESPYLQDIRIELKSILVVE